MITAVTTCMGRRNYLESSLPMMLEEFDDVVVVDWSCPQDSGDWAQDMGARVVWRKGEKYFNISKARNLGAQQVKTRSICFVDSDTLVMPGCAAEVKRLLDLSSMVLSPRRHDSKDVHDLGGFIALDIGHFWGVGGYKGDILEGYGAEDTYLRAQLRLERNLLAKRLPPQFLGAMRHPHSIRTQFYKDSIADSVKKNYEVFESYLKRHGVRDWTTDPRTCDIAYNI